MKGVLILLSVFVIIEGHNQDNDDSVHSMVDPELRNAEGCKSLIIIVHAVELSLLLSTEVEIASEAFIYLYPVLCTMVVLFSHDIWPHGVVYNPLNTFKYTDHIVDWTAMDNSDPSEDYMYAVGMLDLETHPIALNIPAIPDKVCCS